MRGVDTVDCSHLTHRSHTATLGAAAVGTLGRIAPSYPRRHILRRTRVVALATASVIGVALALPMTISNAGAAPGSGSARAALKDTGATPSDNLTPRWKQKYDHRTQKAL